MSIDPSALDSYRDFMGEEADAFIADIVNTFLESAPDLFATMEKALAANDQDEFVRAAHTLKSNSATVGATVLAKLSGELEQQGKEGNLPSLSDKMVAIKTEFPAVITALGK